MTTAELIRQTKASLEIYSKNKGGADKDRLLFEALTRLNHLEGLMQAERNPDALKDMLEGIRDEIVLPFKDLFVEGKKLFPETIKVGNEITLANPVKELRVNNLEDIKFPGEFKIKNFEDFPKSFIAKSASFPVMVKELGLIKALLKKIEGGIGKAEINGDVRIKNVKPSEAIPVKLVTPDGKSFYAAFSAIANSVGGGGRTQLKDSSNAVINPATKELQEAILAALGGSVGETSAGDGEGEVATAGTRVQLSNQACTKVIIQAHESNTGTLVIGGATVVAALSGRRGTALFPTQSQAFEVTNLNKLYIDSTVSGDKFNYYYETQ